MKKIITESKTVIINTRNFAKTGVYFTSDEVAKNEEGIRHFLTRNDGEEVVVADSTFKRYYKTTEIQVETEIEVEEPKAEIKPLTKHQKGALKNIKHGYNWVIGGLENSVQNGHLDEMPPIEEMFEEVYSEVNSCTFDEGFRGCKAAPICMKFAGRAFVREQIAKMFRKDGYKVPEELVKVPERKTGHSNIVDGERINLRNDEGEKLVSVRAFTGMLIGTFKVEEETDSTITVNTAKGQLTFDKSSGIQLNASNSRFANRIEL